MDPGNRTGRTPILDREFPFGNKDLVSASLAYPIFPYGNILDLGRASKMKYSRQGILWLLLSESSYNIPVR
jgi:hypothetical protein